jgi:hypothetical protein
MGAHTKPAEAKPTGTVMATKWEGVLKLEDLEKIKEEFERINQNYRQCFSLQLKLDLIEEVKRLMSTIQSLRGYRG